MVCQRISMLKQMSFGRLVFCSWREPSVNQEIYRQDMYLDNFITVW